MDNHSRSSLQPHLVVREQVHIDARMQITECVDTF